jgi:hemerythrin superfamily protein
MDALTLLREDHRTVESLFKKFEALGDKALKAKRKLVDQMVKELSVHAVIEEQVFYPAVRERVKPLEDEVLEALEEHHVAKWLLSELDGLPAEAERFDAKVSVLMESVRHHVKEEEKTLFPQVKRALKPADLKALGELLQAAKKAAPTRPHPRAPDTPPGNLVAGAVSAVLDVGRDAVRAVTRPRG